MHYRVSDALLIELYRIEIFESNGIRNNNDKLLIELYRIEIVTESISHRKQVNF